MTRVSYRTVFYLSLDAFLLVVCLLHIPHVVPRPGAPFEVGLNKNKVVVGDIID